MTEYNVSSSLTPHFKKAYSFHADFSEGANTQSNPFLGTGRAVRSSIEQFEAALDAEHEVAICCASLGSTIEFRAEGITFCPSNLMTFHGVTDSGERIHLVQHVSQVSFMLKAVRKMSETPQRVAFKYGAVI